MDNTKLSNLLHETSDNLLVHPQTARISLLLQDTKAGEISEENQILLQQLLAFHKQEWLSDDRVVTKIFEDSSVSMLPTRGNVITDFTLKGKKPFYHNPEITQNMEKSLR